MNIANNRIFITAARALRRAWPQVRRRLENRVDFANSKPTPETAMRLQHRVNWAMLTLLGQARAAPDEEAPGKSAGYRNGSLQTVADDRKKLATSAP